MKKLLLFFVSLLLTPFVKAQDSDLFDQTWYLYEVIDTESDLFFNVADYQPYDGNPEIDPISPNFIIDSDLNYSGTGICNNFTGTLFYDVDGNSFGVITSTVEDLSCGTFEDMDEPIVIGPFGLEASDPIEYTIINPQITDDSDGNQTFRFETQPFVTYIYRNVPVLSLNDVTKKTFSVYPNPTTDRIQFSSDITSVVTSVEVFSVFGSLIKKLSNQNGISEMSLSSLNTGVYFIRMFSDTGFEVHQVMKR